MIHAHAHSEQAYVVVSGRGMMIVGDEEREVGADTLVFIPPRTPHAVKNLAAEPLVYFGPTTVSEQDGCSARAAGSPRRQKNGPTNKEGSTTMAIYSRHRSTVPSALPAAPDQQWRLCVTRSLLQSRRGPRESQC